MEFGGITATALYVLYLSFFLCVIFQLKATRSRSNTEKPNTNNLQMSVTPKPLTDAAMPNVMYIV